MGVLTRLIDLIAYKRPLLLFGSIGVLFIIFGFLAGFSAFSEYSATLKIPFIMSVGSLLFLVMGMLMIIAGIILNTLLIIMEEHRH